MIHDPPPLGPAPSPASDPGRALTSKAHVWCARADDLASDPGATAGQIGRALNSLAGLQKDIAQTRLRVVKPLKRAMAEAEAAYRPAEDAIKAARKGLSARAEDFAPHPVVHEDPLFEDEYIAPSEPDEHTGWGQVDTSAQIVGIDRAGMDLEALRPYLSDHALRMAARKHQKATGGKPLRGTVVRDLPVSAMPECPVY